MAVGERSATPTVELTANGSDLKGSNFGGGSTLSGSDYFWAIHRGRRATLAHGY